ncbi:ATP synthase regulation protein NCA2-domain-containing protein [Melampsora americana]|nr:ATP synthase regulation protein NCA2-domain-containing protein [Melampsora americana]
MSFAEVKVKKLSYELETQLLNDQPSADVDVKHNTHIQLLTLSTFSTIIHTLVHQSFSLSEHIEYWSSVERDHHQAAYYFLQTLPNRLYDFSHQFFITSSTVTGETRPTSLNRLSQVVTRPHVFLSSLFPQLHSTNSSEPPSFLSKLSPIFLIKHESKKKRKQLESIRVELAERIGYLLSSFDKLERQLESGSSDAQLRYTNTHFNSLVEDMKRTLIPLDLQPSPSNQERIDESLRQLLTETLPSQQARLQDRIADILPPSFVTRNWPILISLPIASYTLTKSAYSYRQKIYDSLINARETFYGFITGWVLRPIEDILQTLKAGDRGTLAIISDDSLQSEFASLERMTSDFGREKFGWNDERVREMAQHVREGNLTEVLKVWEHEIKTPIKSAIAGSLIRVLLIQIQKVKVDLAIAMEGIQSILRSQSLTFGAIGVAPSMLICFMITKFFSSIIQKRSGVVGKSTKAVRKDVRLAMRSNFSFLPISRCGILMSL